MNNRVIHNYSKTYKESFKDISEVIGYISFKNIPVYECHKGGLWYISHIHFRDFREFKYIRNTKRYREIHNTLGYIFLPPGFGYLFEYFDDNTCKLSVDDFRCLMNDGFINRYSFNKSAVKERNVMNPFEVEIEYGSRR